MWASVDYRQGVRPGQGGWCRGEVVDQGGRPWSCRAWTQRWELLRRSKHMAAQQRRRQHQEVRQSNQHYKYRPQRTVMWPRGDEGVGGGMDGLAPVGATVPVEMHDRGHGRREHGETETRGRESN